MVKPEDVVEAFADAWNRHDMEALAALFCDNARFVNRFGHYVKGVDAIVAMHRPIHETIYRDSVLANELIDVAAVTDRVCVVHMWSRLTAGEAHPAGAHAVDTVIQAVIVSGSGGWRIQALENVTVVDPRTGAPVLRA